MRFQITQILIIQTFFIANIVYSKIVSIKQSRYILKIHRKTLFNHIFFSISKPSNSTPRAPTFTPKTVTPRYYRHIRSSIPAQKPENQRTHSTHMKKKTPTKTKSISADSHAHTTQLLLYIPTQWLGECARGKSRKRGNKPLT